MKKIITIILGVLLTVSAVHAVPPSPPTLDDLTKRSDVIAIVSVTIVTDHVSTKVAWKKGKRQSAVATVKHIIKGTAPATVGLTYQGPPLQISCHPPSLATGEFMVFLRRDGKEFVRTDLWYSQVTVTT